MCSNNGDCVTKWSGDWRCQCNTGWDGDDCSTRLETNCNDGLDNDGGKTSIYTLYLFIALLMDQNN